MSDIVERLRNRKEPNIEFDMHYPQIVDSDTPDAECLEAAAEIERLRAALRDIDHARYTDRNTINPDNAFEHAIALNEKLIAVMDNARAALAEENKG
jgi:hypothetical protein